jgi:hypothetical protein
MECEQKATFSSGLLRIGGAGAGLAFCALLCAGCAATGGMGERGSVRPAVTQSVEDTWGVKDLVIRLTARGSMLDFRFRVVDPAKAAPLFSHDIRPYLVDEKKGTILVVPDLPKVGPVRSTTRNPLAGQEHFILFANPNQELKKGDKVVVVIGDFKKADLVIR